MPFVSSDSKNWNCPLNLLENEVVKKCVKLRKMEIQHSFLNRFYDFIFQAKVPFKYSKTIKDNRNYKLSCKVEFSDNLVI